MSQVVMEHDVNEVITMYLKGHFGKERGELFQMIHQEMLASKAAKHLLAEVAQEACTQGYDPVNLLALGLNYGLVVGIFLERERANRKRRIYT